jgi:hypothetical protein
MGETATLLWCEDAERLLESIRQARDGETEQHELT